MAILKAKEKLMILATGKATLKELNELEKQAENEGNEPDPKPDPEPDPKPDPEPDPKPDPEPDPEPDEKDLKIAELEAKLKEAQKKNVNDDIGGSTPSFDEQLDSMFKDYKF